MSSKHEHNNVGMLTSFAVECVELLTEDRKKDGKEVLGRLILSVIGGYVGSSAPDIFEPAYSPNHRSVCHSWVVMSGSVYLTIKAITDMDNVNPYLSALFRGGSVGYTSHLALDATTQKGLPILR